MNLLNKVLVVFSTFLLLILVVAVVYSVWMAPRDLALFLRGLALFTSNNPGVVRLAATVIGGVIILVSLLILLAEISPEPREDIRISNVKGGAARVSIQAIKDRIKNEVEQLEQIHSAEPIVKSTGSAAEIHVQVRTLEDSYPERASDIFHVIRNVVERDMGIKIRRLNATFATYSGPSTPVSSPSSQQSEQHGVIIVPDAGSESAQEDRPSPGMGTRADAEKREVLVPYSNTGPDSSQEEGKRKEEGL